MRPPKPLPAETPSMSVASLKLSTLSTTLPRYLYFSTISNSCWFILNLYLVQGFCLLLWKCMTLVFPVLMFNIHLWHHISNVLIYFWSPSLLSLRRMISSVYARELTIKSLYIMLLSHLSISDNNGLMKHGKNDGLRLSPCLTPYLMPNQSVNMPFKHMLLVISLYKDWIETSNLPLMPISFNLTNNRSLSTRSKAFLKST